MRWRAKGVGTCICVSELAERIRPQSEQCPMWKYETGEEMFEGFIYLKMALKFACQPSGDLVSERLRPSSVLERDVEMMSTRVRRPD